eukprot:TRINITY_DN7408_c0_g1_i1.p1 TRINITY_DN7408_c0_g1~~TRINITY_DN7408_c0_g1_i1.p1  ORF type:complete len:509 (+),score=124.66 TRINITY_DN7408_c0_g1_i1:36-1562(+)
MAVAGGENHDPSDHGLNDCEVFPLQRLPSTELKHVLKFLTTQEKNELRLACKSFDETVFHLCSYAKTWNITINQENMQDLMIILEAAKVRHTNNPRNLKIKMNFDCCKILGKIDAIGNRSLQLPDCLSIKQKLLSDWGNHIIELKTEILGNEAFLNQAVLPNLQSVEFRVYHDRITQSNKQIMQSVMANHANKIKKLEFNNISFHGVNFKPALPKLSVNTLIFNKWQIETLDTMMNACQETLKVLDINSCFSLTRNPFRVLTAYKNRMPKLKHLQIRYCTDEFRGILYQIVPTKLVTLRLMDNDVDEYEVMRMFAFPRLKFFWFDADRNSICPYLAQYAMASLEVLVALKLQNDFKAKFQALKFPKLKELMVDGHDTWSFEFIKQNASTLERLTILQPKKGLKKLKGLDCQFPNMKMLALRFSGAPAQPLVRALKSKCPQSTLILTDNEQICTETRQHAEKYPWPMFDIAEDMETVVKARDDEEQGSGVYAEGGFDYPAGIPAYYTEV